MKRMVYYILVVLIYSIIFLDDCNIRFDLPYTLTAICIYIVSNSIYFHRRKNIVCFELFFSIVFFFASFLTYFIVDEGAGFAFFAFSGKSQSLVQGVALAMIGYHSYLCGLSSLKYIEVNSLNCYNKSLLVSKSAAIWANWICLFTFCLFIATGGMNLLYIYSRDVSRDDANIGMLLYWILAYTVAIYDSFASVDFTSLKCRILDVTKFNKLFIVNSIIIVVFLMISGYRSQAMQVIIPILICYSVFVKKISAKVFFAILLCGLLMMIAIGITRSGGEFNRDVSMLYYFRDFNAANASLGFFVDEVELNGITGGSNYILQALSVVPFLQSIVGAFVDFNSFSLPSSRFYTYSFDTDSGLGTHLIGDIYYTFGLAGVIIVMYLVGRFCSSLSSFKNRYIFLMYLIFTGNAIFAVRVELLYIVRMLAFGCIIFLVVEFLSKQKHSI